jgi:endogenous inhibitor of DNA gyrase (YacG/DUF329 family)
MTTQAIQQSQENCNTLPKPSDKTQAPVPARYTAEMVEAASQTGGSCAGCGRALGHDDPVWRRRVSRKRGWGSTVAPVCEECQPTWRSVRTSGQCEGCGRLVHNTEGFGRRRVYCSKQCELLRQHAIARQRRAEARGASRACAECSEHFEPSRADAQFCSTRCKQKAYRKRVTLNKWPADGNIAIRNVTFGECLADENIASRNGATP